LCKRGRSLLCMLDLRGQRGHQRTLALWLASRFKMIKK
jgi:hypothetical protein